jgi:hypothetical protein
MGARGCGIAAEEAGAEGMAEHLQASGAKRSINATRHCNFSFPKRA